MKIYLVHLILLWNILTFPTCLYAQNVNFNKQIENLRNIPDSEVYDSTSAIFNSINGIVNIDSRLKYTKSITVIVKEKDERTYCNALAHLGEYSDTNNMYYLNKSLNIAQKMNLVYESGWINAIISQYYMSIQKYDSAMQHILISRDYFEKLCSREHIALVVHIIGDLYFSASLYDEAKKEYLFMLNEHLKGVFNYSWRYVVILNNLGLIEEAQGNLKGAFNYFKKTLDYCYSNYKKGDGFNTTIYTLNRMGIIRFKENLFDEALIYFSEAENTSIESQNFNFLSNIYLNKSKVFLKKGDLKSAIFYSEKAEEFTDKMESVGSFWRDFYFLQSDIKNEMGDFKSALEFHKKGTEIANKQIVQAEKSKALLILASKNYQIMNNELTNSKRETQFFILSFVIISIILIMTIIFYLRLRRSNLKLVENEIQKSHTIGEGAIYKNSCKKNTEHDINLIEISNKFKILMEDEKKFLDSEIDLEKAAELLGTNRTYLSKVLNGILNINFNNYINSLRIKESIQLIKNGDAERLTIEGLANQVGFKHRSVFRRAFQKETGVTPSFFIDNYKK